MILPPRQLIRGVGIVCLTALLGACSSTGAPQPPTGASAQQATSGGDAQPESTAAGTQQSDKPALPSAVVSEFERGVRALQAKAYDQAEAIFYDMTQRYPDLPGPYANLGAVLLAKKDYETAETALKRAQQLNPGNAEIYNHLGMLYRRDGRFDKALEAYRQGLEIAPNNSNLLRNAGILLELYLNTPAAALEYYQRYIELKPDDRQVQIWIADLSRRIEP
ncbi:hypothetical protein Tel_13995 [Candidatus Tenderia electrophaga]|jgi:Flp pilus assembly protein TadD|uniref:Uncharacterized protein n=1 Tax=Candidatus Tenderia electrophaga TaxID=1748243 RepID=A0A0S2TGG2_9GAMM|nr:hypothetical protein Tel_13995 [Candidatus Tenderia electrophaga]